MNEGIHLDLDTWIVPGQIRKANLCRGLGNRYTPAGTEVLRMAWLTRSPNHRRGRGRGGRKGEVACGELTTYGLLP